MHTTVDTRNLPSGYSTRYPPDPMVVCDHDQCLARAHDGDKTGCCIPWKVLHCGQSYHDFCIGDTKCKKCHSFLANLIEELTEAFNEGLLNDNDKDANRNEEDASQDLLLDDDEDDEDDIIGQATPPLFNDFEGLELFRRDFSKNLIQL